MPICKIKHSRLTISFVLLCLSLLIVLFFSTSAPLIYHLFRLLRHKGKFILSHVFSFSSKTIWKIKIKNVMWLSRDFRPKSSDASRWSSKEKSLTCDNNKIKRNWYCVRMKKKSKSFSCIIQFYYSSPCTESCAALPSIDWILFTLL